MNRHPFFSQRIHCRSHVQFMNGCPCASGSTRGQEPPPPASYDPLHQIRTRRRTRITPYFYRAVLVRSVAWVPAWWVPVPATRKRLLIVSLRCTQCSGRTRRIGCRAPDCVEKPVSQWQRKEAHQEGRPPPLALRSCATCQTDAPRLAGGWAGRGCESHVSGTHLTEIKWHL